MALPASTERSFFEESIKDFYPPGTQILYQNEPCKIEGKMDRDGFIKIYHRAKVFDKAIHHSFLKAKLKPGMSVMTTEGEKAYKIGKVTRVFEDYSVELSYGPGSPLERTQYNGLSSLLPYASEEENEMERESAAPRILLEMQYGAHPPLEISDGESDPVSDAPQILLEMKRRRPSYVEISDGESKPVSEEKPLSEVSPSVSATPPTPSPATSASIHKKKRKPSEAQSSEKVSKKEKPASSAAIDAEKWLDSRKAEMIMAKPEGHLSAALINRVASKDRRLPELSFRDPEFQAYMAGVYSKEKLPAHLACVQIPGMEHLGWAIYLKPDAQEIKPKQFIGLYTGIIKVTDLSDETPNSYLFDLVLVDPEALSRPELEALRCQKGNTYSIVVDGEKAGNFSRFINHTSDKRANVEAKILKIRDLPGASVQVQIGLFAKETIRPGCQLLMSYGKHYWETKGIDPKEIAPNSHILTARSRGSKAFRVVCQAKGCECSLGSA